MGWRKINPDNRRKDKGYRRRIEFNNLSEQPDASNVPRFKS
jgi:hypothetical protein